MRTKPIPNPDRIADELGRIAVMAGRLLADIVDRTVGHRLKEDGSPSTDADGRAEALIVGRLAAAWPDIPVVAEEAGGTAARHDAFFLVDPLDGTRDYLAGAAEYSVNIALVVDGRPVAAALAAPGLGRLWIAGRHARCAAVDGVETRDWRPARVRPSPKDGLVALGSRRHGDPATDSCLAVFPVAALRTSSSAVKFGLIASGEADIYVRCGPTMEWDTAAGDHILTRAGGTVIGSSGAPLTYGHPERGYLNGPFAALGDPELAARVKLPARS